MSLRWRIAVGLGAIAVLVATFAAAAAYISTADRLDQGIDETLHACAVELARTIRPRPRAGNATGVNVPASSGDEANDGSVFPPTGGFTRPDGCPPVGALQPAGERAAPERVGNRHRLHRGWP